MRSEWNDKILTVKPDDFEALALDIFRHQYQQNNDYRQYVDALRLAPSSIQTIQAIPYLPIRFFKSRELKTGDFQPAAVFESSGTTGSINSRHLVKDLSLYQDSFFTCFQSFYGPIEDYCVIGLLPSYLERQNASLVYMVDAFIRRSTQPESGFYLDETNKLMEVLSSLEARGQQTLLIGVSFALLDLAEKYSQQLRHTIIMETGGMKGRRKELVRQEMHDILIKAFGIHSIHSEYGMTELLSQAYSKGDGIFQCPPWMKILLRDEEDPLSVRTEQELGKPMNGAINIIDLANIHSCSFIATDDAGRLYPDGRFEVLGRMDNSDLRGCSLMVL